MSVFEKDLYRYYGETGETLKQRILRPYEIKYICCMRRIQESGSQLKRAYYRLKLKRLSNITGLQISYQASIGEGFYIGHCGRIIINPRVKMGKNINIATGVTIGQENRGERKGCPTVGNNCWIGTNAVIVGNINIGNDVLIAPLSYVNFDVPDHSIVIGNPAKIIHRDNATEGYINKTV